MKEVVKYLRILSLAAAMLLAACGDDKDYHVPAGECSNVTFSIQVPQTKGAVSSDYDNVVDRLDVLVFDQDSSFMYSASGSKAGVGENGDQQFNILLEGRYGVEKYIFCVLANAGDGVVSGAGVREGDGLGEVRGRLVESINAGEGWDPDAGYIPMWGEFELQKIEPGTYTVGMLRMLAKVNLRVSEEVGGVFEMKEIRLCNYHTAGYIIPDPSELRWSEPAAEGGPGSRYVAGPTINGEWEPIGINAPVVIGEDDMADNNILYLFEAAEGVEGDNAGNICMIVGAEWQPAVDNTRSEPSLRYFRLDFADHEEGYVAVKRNFFYDIIIEHIEGDGHETPEGAYNESSLRATISEYMPVDIPVVIEDLDHIFLLSDISLEFHSNKWDINQKSYLIIENNYTTGWRIDKITDVDESGNETGVMWSHTGNDWVSSGDPWIYDFTPRTSSDMEGEPANDIENGRKHTVWFKFGRNVTGRDRRAYVYFYYGRHVYPMLLVQKAEQGVGYTNQMNGEWMQIARFDYSTEYGDADEAAKKGTNVFSLTDMEAIAGSEEYGADDYWNSYHVPTRSEMIMIWVYERAFEDETTGLAYEGLFDKKESDYEISPATTYWSRGHYNFGTGHENHNFAWLNMARGKIACANFTGTPTVEYERDEYSGSSADIVRRLRRVRRNQDRTVPKYPYTVWHGEGPAIVSNYAGKGVFQSALLGGNIDEDHYEHDFGNSVAAILQVAPEDVDARREEGVNFYERAKNACAKKETPYDNKWRLPTQRELQLIYALGGMSEEEYSDGQGLSSFPSVFDPEGIRLKNLYDYNDHGNGWSFTPLSRPANSAEGELFWYWTSTKVDLSGGEGSYWAVSNSGQTVMMSPTSDTGLAKVRCVRAVTGDQAVEDVRD